MRWIYETNSDNSARFVLGVRGENPLVCVGVNPSTAEPNKLDPTLQCVKAWSKRLGYDGWIMLNLYPQRATNPSDLHDAPCHFLHRENKKWIYRYLGSVYISPKIIWAAWGTLIKKRRWLHGCLQNIIADAATGHKWITIGKRSNAGHPHHPLYLSLKSEVQEFDIQKYITEF